MAAVTAQALPARFGVPLALLALVLLALLLWQQRPQRTAPQLQQAVLLARPVSLGAFQLQDHQGLPVQPATLQGRWHLLSYGYTYCPDVCPLTLAKLANLQQQLASEAEFSQLDLLFYSIDPKRDSAVELAQYLQYFAADIRGLRPDPQVAALAKPFEQALSLRFNVQNDGIAPDSADYLVAHGIMLYLLNPDARLQAVFLPTTRPGVTVPEFDVDVLQADYLAIRRYLAAK
ncbi:SCO family protein [Rheinheimera muenzenbergensis]|uniref:SCO family protein n=1 Tax=Rheinheimera muenzenbergensis TaxID=1193628 RepID=A0ABU8C337_9GAMM